MGKNDTPNFLYLAGVLRSTPKSDKYIRCLLRANDRHKWTGEQWDQQNNDSEIVSYCKQVKYPFSWILETVWPPFPQTTWRGPKSYLQWTLPLQDARCNRTCPHMPATNQLYAFRTRESNLTSKCVTAIILPASSRIRQIPTSACFNTASNKISSPGFIP